MMFSNFLTAMTARLPRWAAASKKNFVAASCGHLIVGSEKSVPLGTVGKAMGVFRKIEQPLVIVGQATYEAFLEQIHLMDKWIGVPPELHYTNV
jgi:hypothetical protein